MKGKTTTITLQNAQNVSVSKDALFQLTLIHGDLKLYDL